MYIVPVVTGEEEDERVAREADTDGEVEDDCVEDSEGVTSEVTVIIPVLDWVSVPREDFVVLGLAVEVTVTDSTALLVEDSDGEDDPVRVAIEGVAE